MTAAILPRWAQAEQCLVDAKASGKAEEVRELLSTVNDLRRHVKEIRIVGNSPDDKLLAAIFGGEKIDLSSWRKYL